MFRFFGFLVLGTSHNGELAGGGFVTVTVGCWPRREGWVEGGAAGGREGGGRSCYFFCVCSTTSSIYFKYLI